MIAFNYKTGKKEDIPLKVLLAPCLSSMTVKQLKFNNDTDWQLLQQYVE